MRKLEIGSSQEEVRKLEIPRITRLNRCTATPVGVSFATDENLIGKRHRLRALDLVKNHQLALGVCRPVERYQSKFGPIQSE